jgi:hypothetical protein
MENAGILYGQFGIFLAIWYILRPFGNFVVITYIFPHFGTLYQEKSGNPGARSRMKSCRGHSRSYCDEIAMRQVIFPILE